MNNLYYIPFFLFIAGAYYYYSSKAKKQAYFYNNKRKNYITENSDLTEQQVTNLQKDLPWEGLTSAELTMLFGEPRRKRVLDESLTKYIWSYADIFIYIKDDKVVEWKKK
jgi:hypothetical protein